MERLGSAIQKVLGSLRGQQRAAEEEVAGVLKKCLTKKELRHIKIKYFRDGVLGLTVDSAAFLYEMRLRAGELKERYAREAPAVKDIRISVGVLHDEKEKTRDAV